MFRPYNFRRGLTYFMVFLFYQLPTTVSGDMQI